MTAVELGRLPPIGPAVVTLGVFDGVHLGHRQVLTATAEAARRHDAAPVALVFSPHPDEVLRPGTEVPRLLPPALTLERIGALGIRPLEVRFDDALRSCTPEDFLGRLGPALDLRAVTMTRDSAFGKGRAGTLDRVRQIGAEAGFEAIGVEPAAADGAPVSSSRIRSLLAAGDVGATTRLLAGPPLLRGTVVHGDRRGRLLGYPTANLRFDYRAAMPALGIYLGRVHVPARDVGPGHPALVSVGVRPTFEDDGRVLVEAFLLDWDGDLYDAELDVELVARLRDELRFESAEALVEQMRRDEEDARRLVAAEGA
ncbi:MAG: bifunctional riboflavin kinase/FMN adenylyltransferase [Chloroflexi bacterium]|nr:bifunctional riboflavin kinase/FMN adenylyltransferase [Chloroflexota bacterium]